MTGTTAAEAEINDDFVLGGSFGDQALHCMNAVEMTSRTRRWKMERATMVVASENKELFRITNNCTSIGVVISDNGSRRACRKEMKK